METGIMLLIGYLLGSLNFAIIISKLVVKTDIRSFGSGNAGATNALRALGKKWGAVVLLGDILKCAVASIIAVCLFSGFEMPLYGAVLGAVLGHNFPLYYKFKGGKGIIVSITGIFFLNWQIALIILAFALVIMALTRYVSLGSVSAAVLAPILAYIMARDIFDLILILASLAIYMHRANIYRLIDGTENRLGAKKPI